MTPSLTNHKEDDATLAAIAVVDGNVDDIETETDKIDQATTDGLAGTMNSLAYRVGEIERHLHSGARWFGAAVAPDAELHVADRIGAGVIPFEVDGGNLDWGTWTQILGSEDTPTVVGKAYFDPHLMIVDDVENASVYFIQFARGETGAGAYAAGNYTELIYDAANTKDTAIIPVQTGRAPAASKLWCRVLSYGDNTGWMKFFLGIHEYEG